MNIKDKIWDKLKVFFKTEESAEVAPFVKIQKKTKAVKARRIRNRIAKKSRRINRQVVAR